LLVALSIRGAFRLISFVPAAAALDQVHMTIEQVHGSARVAGRARGGSV
jgi:hypothetical protein